MLNLKTLFLASTVVLLSCKAKENISTETVATCEADQGCTFYRVELTRAQIDQILSKGSFFAAAKAQAVLVLSGCAPFIEEEQTPETIDLAYGGTGKADFAEGFDLREYIQQHGCLTFANNTKRIDFTATADGETYHGYAYLNINKGEAYMPNESFQAMYPPLEGTITVDVLMQHKVIKQYMIDAEGRKWVMDMSIGLTFGPSPEDAVSLEHFNQYFHKTGNRSPFLNTGLYTEEYTGKDAEGNTINIWLVVSTDVMLQPGEFSLVGLYNLGYLQFGGITYLMNKITGSGFTVELTAIRDEEYRFDPTGYSPITMP